MFKHLLELQLTASLSAQSIIETIATPLTHDQSETLAAIMAEDAPLAQKALASAYEAILWAHRQPHVTMTHQEVSDVFVSVLDVKENVMTVCQHDLIELHDGRYVLILAPVDAHASTATLKFVSVVFASKHGESIGSEQEVIHTNHFKINHH